MTNPDCRTCRAGRLQAQNAAIAYFCPDHGVTEYVPGDHIRELEAALRAVRTWSDCTSAGPGRDAQRAFPAGREAFFEDALDRIYALAADALTDA